MKQSTKELIATFAKSNKVSKEKLEKLVKSVITIQVPQKKKQTVKNVKVVSSRGPKVSEAMEILREKIKADVVTLKEFTTRDLAVKYNTDRFHVNPVLYSLEKKGLVKREAATLAHHRGRQPNIWKTI